MRKEEGAGRREGGRDGRERYRGERSQEREKQGVREISLIQRSSLSFLISQRYGDTIPAAPTHAHMNILPVTIQSYG